MNTQKVSPRPTRVEAGLAPILIVILITLGVGGYLLFQKQVKPVVVPQQTAQSTTSAETASWKTYTNTEVGFSIKYPNDILVQLVCPYEESKNFYLAKREGWDSAEFKKENVINMQTCGRGGKYFLEIKVQDRQAVKPKADKLVTEDILVGGKNAKKYIVTIKPEGSLLEYWFAEIQVFYNNKTYILSYDDKNDEETINQILSTFRFD